MPAVAGLRWGTLVARADFSDVSERLTSMRITLISVVLAVGLLLFSVVFIGVHRTVLRPIEQLARTATAMAVGELDARVDIRTRDEFGHLANTFNTMADELAENTRSLEYKVTMRTKALEDVNQQLASAVETLERLARTDELTGLLNRRALDKSLAFEVQRSARTGSPLALLILDLDHFKQVNDNYGHPAGDLVLRTAAELFRQRLRGIDIVARLGGEEFAVLLLDSGAKAAQKVAENLVTAVRENTFCSTNGKSMGRITMSIGYAIFPDDAKEAEVLISRADEALYASKEAGRDRATAWHAPPPSAANG